MSCTTTSYPGSYPSLCIPRVFANIKEERIRSIFENLDIAEISRIEIIKTLDNKFNRVYVHFLKWKSNDNGKNARKCVLGGNVFKVIYDDPWFWKISALKSSSSTTTSIDNKESKKDNKPRIVFDDDDSSTNKKRKHEKSEKKKTKKPEEKKKKPRKVQEEVLQEEEKKKDEEITCRQCNNVFVFAIRDQEFFKLKGFKDKPRRCRACVKKHNTPEPEPVVEPIIDPPPTIIVEDEKKDKEITCKQCNNVFVFAISDQEHYKSLGFHLIPVRCKACAKMNNANRKWPISLHYAPADPVAPVRIVSPPPSIRKKTTTKKTKIEIVIVEEDDDC
jgi:hypothetical protein